MIKITLFVATVMAAAGVAWLTVGPAASTGSSLASAPTHTIRRGELVVSVTEQGTLESANNTEIKCRVRGSNTITFVIESGTEVQEGEELIRLETLAIEEEISERTKFFHLAESQVARSKADVERAKLAISEYEEGRFVSELSSLQKDLAVAESRLLNSKNRLKHSRMMSRSEYASELEVEEKEFASEQAEMNVGLIQTRIEVLENYTKQEELVRLRGELKVAEATWEADVERALADKKRLERAKEELRLCSIVAGRSGLVIYPDSEEWENAPKIEEGGTVNKDQTLLLMPDLNQMQVKVGIHESVIDRLKAGMQASVTLNRDSLSGEVTYVATVAKPAGWWTGNVVKYDTIVSLPTKEDLRPGMSAEVEIILARHENVVTIPTNACIETQDGFTCWVQTESGVQRRPLRLGDSSEMFVVVLEGVDEGEQVILDPLANVPEAQTEAAAALNETRDRGFGFDDL
ncbi:MAG: HlyD family efflux transporter periplasmic adaptor subunit [Planctomycetota bacterium]